VVDEDVDRIQGARITGEVFVPRFAIELTPEGPYSILPTTTGGSSGSRRGFGASGRNRTRWPRRAGSGGRAASSYGPTYVYECTYCGKRFNRKTRTTTLNPHKDKSGYPCAGRYAYLVDTRY
jgi:hypothetical protein